MATARAILTFPGNCSISVAVTGDSGTYPDALAEITTRCRQLLREVVADWNASAEVEAEG